MPGELESYRERLDDLRRLIGELIADLPAEALNWRPIEGTGDDATNSLAVLATHVAGAEHFWIAEVIGQQPATRDRDAEFRTAAVHAEELVRKLEAVGAETRQVFAALSETELNGVRIARGHEVTVRWGILHMIEHSALHLGHMQITYQLWMSGKAKPSPLWASQLPKKQATGN